MAMQVAKRGSRPSEAAVRILSKLKLLSFNAGMCRQHGLTKNKHKYALIGYDSTSKDIGISFLKERGEDGYAMKITWTAKGTSFSFPIRALLSSFTPLLNINNISGTYTKGAITANVEIKGFAKNGYLLHVTERSEK